MGIGHMIDIRNDSGNGMCIGYGVDIGNDWFRKGRVIRYWVSFINKLYNHSSYLLGAIPFPARMISSTSSSCWARVGAMLSHCFLAQ
jgi:hypothetical protein